MKNLESVLNDFYLCLNIPIKYLDKDLNTILEKGYSKDLEDFVFNLDIVSNINKNKLNSTQLNYFDNIHFLCLPFIKMETLKGFFIIGPFKSGSSSIELNIPLKPHTCIKYIENMLNHLIRDRVLTTTNFNSYVVSAIKYIHQNYHHDICIDDVCNFLGINKSYFCSLFKKETGFTFCNFLNMFRIEMSKKILCNKDYSILDVALTVGYNNHNYFSSLFKKLNNITPLEYRNNI